MATTDIPAGTQFTDPAALLMFEDDLQTLEALGRGTLSINPDYLEHTHARCLSVEDVAGFTRSRDLEDALAFNALAATQASAWHRGARGLFDPTAGDADPVQAAAVANAVLLRAQTQGAPGGGGRPLHPLENLAFLFMTEDKGDGPCRAAQAIAALPPGMWDAVRKGRACMLKNSFSQMVSAQGPTREVVLSLPFALMNHGCADRANIMMTETQLPVVLDTRGAHATCTMSCLVTPWVPGGTAPATHIPAGTPLLTSYRAPGETLKAHARALAEFGIRGCGCDAAAIDRFNAVCSANNDFRDAWKAAHPKAMQAVLESVVYFRGRNLRLAQVARALVEDPLMVFSRTKAVEVAAALAAAQKAHTGAGDASTDRVILFQGLAFNIKALCLCLGVDRKRIADHPELDCAANY